MRRILEICRQQGYYTAVKKVLDNLHHLIVVKLNRIRRRFVSDWDYIQFRLWKQSVFDGYQATTDPFKTLWISPDSICYHTLISPSNRLAAGRVKGGDWDQGRKQFEEMYIFQCFRDRFVHGCKWEKTDFILECIDKNRTWKGCKNPEEIYNRCDKMDELYERIDKEGFRSKQELIEKDVPSAIKAGGPLPLYLDNIAVDIGRDGQFLFVDGKHRLAIAKLLEVDSVPVNVVVRHKKWQAIREEVAMADSINGLSGRARQYLPHPDLTALAPKS